MPEIKNAFIKGKMNTSFEASAPHKAASKAYNAVSKYFHNSTPEFLFTLQKVKSKRSDIGEGKILNIAKYNSKKDFEETNKWLQPLFTKMMKELDGIVESIPGEVVFSWSRQINKV